MAKIINLPNLIDRRIKTEEGKASERGTFEYFERVFLDLKRQYGLKLSAPVPVTSQVSFAIYSYGDQRQVKISNCDFGPSTFSDHLNPSKPRNHDLVTALLVDGTILDCAILINGSADILNFFESRYTPVPAGMVRTLKPSPYALPPGVQRACQESAPQYSDDHRQTYFVKVMDAAKNVYHVKLGQIFGKWGAVLGKDLLDINDPFDISHLIAAAQESLRLTDALETYVIIKDG